jgi:uncharacterized protein YecT (DUF1311 family)
MNKTLLVVFLFFSLLTFSQTQKKSENAIDAIESKCLNKDNISNADMCNCTIDARESWDKELNKYYNLLKTKLPAAAFAVLKESQKEWMIYRDKEYAFISKFYYEVQEGTMWYAVAEGKKKELVKTRAIELQQYYKMLEF